MEPVAALIQDFERFGFEFSASGENLAVAPPAGFGEMSAEDLEWFRQHKAAIIEYLVSREWPRTEPVAGSGPCEADDCAGRVSYVAGRGECDRCGIHHRIVVGGALPRYAPPVIDRHGNVVDLESRRRARGKAA
jgi:hypothetical protein